MMDRTPCNLISSQTRLIEDWMLYLAEILDANMLRVAI